MSGNVLMVYDTTVPSVSVPVRVGTSAMTLFAVAGAVLSSATGGVLGAVTGMVTVAGVVSESPSLSVAV
ncbi:hypothetical protein [Kamptonema formosum]|uniref:hypothetical protein n=1 Tax=Kamptonema formosum TaxID=331992 RepID=UPI0012DC3811